MTAVASKIDLAFALDRREFTLGAAAATLLVALAPETVLAQTPEAKLWEEQVKKIVGDAKPTEGKITIDMAEIAENGNTVPFSLSVESAMTDKDYVKTLYLISTGNPRPEVATFRFTPQSGVAKAESRMRLAVTQDVIAIAEMGDGKFYTAKRSVKVTVGGCGG
jgi:sulfur-oxidizing protein SoxY